jgi:hypothetical protein
MSISKIFSILNFVKKQMMKTDKDGIMKLPSELKAKYGEAVIIKQLMDAGVDPRTIKSEQQLIGVLDSIDAMRAKRTTKPGTTGIMKTKEAEVFDLKGNKLDPDKKITGGTQETEDMIKKKLEKQNKESIKKIKERKFEDAVKAEQDKMAADEDYIPDIIDPDDFAIGGRVGLKKGSMDRRTFLKIMGGLATLPIVGRFFRGAERTAPMAEKAVEAVQAAPNYFFELLAKIKMFGNDIKGSGERITAKKYKDYTLEEDIVTGDVTIKKTKEGVVGDMEGVMQEEYMILKKGNMDETTKGRIPPDEYEELTVKPDMEGKMKDVEGGLDSVEEIINEVSKKSAPIKKAAGGLAYMLGE